VILLLTLPLPSLCYQIRCQDEKSSKLTRLKRKDQYKYGYIDQV